MKGLGRFLTSLTPEMEEDLVQHLLLLEQRLFGLTRKDVQRLAFQLAEKNDMQHQFNRAKEIAGRDWLDGFCTRHPQLSIRRCIDLKGLVIQQTTASTGRKVFPQSAGDYLPSG